MSDDPPGIDLRAVLAGIDRDLAESAKLREETNKFTAEAHKLQAEAAKLRVDRWIAPVLVLASVLGGSIVAVVNHLWK